MTLVLFVAELGSGFGHVRRLLPLARAAVHAGYRARFLVANPLEVGGCLGSAGFELAAAPTVPRTARNLPEPGAVATSFGDVLGGSGFADADFLRAICARWDSELAALRPLAVVSELSPFLNLACFGGAIPVLSVGHGFILPPPHLPSFPRIWAGTSIYAEPRLLEHVAGICRSRQRSSPHALPELIAGSLHAVTGLEALDPYRLERRQPAVGPPDLASDLDARTPSDDVFVYLLGEADVTLTVLRALRTSGLRGSAYIRRGSAAQRETLAGSGIVWLETADDGRRALARARLVIHHGSMLTAEEALYLAQPQIVVPLYLEHLITARALACLGVAVVLRPPHDVIQIGRTLALSLTDISMQQAARTFAEGLTVHGRSPPDLAATLIASIVAQSTVTPRQVPSDIEPSDPIISFVVPSYQMAPYLALSLESLTIMQRDTSKQFEVVVVDDGSTDDTREVCMAAGARSSGLQLRYLHRPRDERSSRSLTRNLGVAASRGRYVVFLDAGVMVHPELLILLLRHWTGVAGASEHVLAIGSLGLFVSQSHENSIAPIARFRALSPQALLSIFHELSFAPAWLERRQEWFDFAQGDLSQLPAPWLLAWSCALGVPRRLFDAVSGFDETLLTWGAEDCDFALRMHEMGAHFHAFAAPATLHVPHPTEADASKKAQNRANALRMHRKRHGRESELFVVFEDPFAANMLAMRLDRAPLEQMLPTWDASSCGLLRHLLGTNDGALIVAAPTPQLVAHILGVTWAVPSRSLFQNIVRVTGTDAVKLSMFCHSDEPTGAREVVILTDLLRLLPPTCQRQQLQEALRVGRRVYFVSTELAIGARDDSAIHRELAGWSLSSMDSLSALATTMGVTLTELVPKGQLLRAYAVVRSSA